MITDPQYRRGQLLINYLTSSETVHSYLQPFLQNGAEFNGTTVCMGSLNELYVAHNYTDEECHIQQVDTAHLSSFSNGKLNDNWGKERLGKQLIASIFSYYDGDLEELKNLLFKVAECRTRP